MTSDGSSSERRLLADLQPGGRYWASDLHKVGGVPTVMRAMLEKGVLNRDCPTITGPHGRRDSRGTASPDGVVVRNARTRLRRQAVSSCSRAILRPRARYSRLPGSANRSMRVPARCFDSEEAAVRAVRERAYEAGDVIVVRYQGPRGGRECLRCSA